MIFNLYLQKWIQHDLDEIGTNFHSYLGSMQHSATHPDGIILALLGPYLGLNITVVSCDGYWTSNEKKPDVVLAFLGEAKFTRTKVGKYISG